MSKGKGNRKKKQQSNTPNTVEEPPKQKWYEADLSVPENLIAASRQIFSLDFSATNKNGPYCLEVTKKNTKKGKDDNDDDDDADLRKAIEASLADSSGSLSLSCEDPIQLVKEDVKFPSGIKNQGATCYMNSFLQTLFTIPDFRKSLYNWKPSSEKSDDTQVSVCKELQSLFSSLECTNRKFVDASKLVQALGIDPSVQEDPQEFWSLFLSFIEHEVPDISKLFFGKMQSLVKCGKCGKTKSTPYGFNTVNLNVKTSSFEKALDQYMEVEKLDDENKYVCNSCGVTDNSERVTRIKSLPPYLNFSVMRYDYDFTSQTRKKIMDPFSFPLTFNFSKFFYPKIKETKPEYEYELMTVLEHKGVSAVSGHYVCKTVRDGKWYEFNDEVVTPIDLDKMVTKTKSEWGKSNEKIRGTKKTVQNEKKTASQPSQPPQQPQQPQPQSKSSSLSLSSSSSSSSSKGVISEKNKLEDTEETYPRIKSESVYMLTYRRKDITKVEYELPLELISLVLEENDELDTNVKISKDTIAQKEKEDKELSDFKSGIIKDSKKKDDGDYVWMSFEWWEDFVLADHKVPIDNSGLTCPHGFVDIDKRREIRCIKKESWDKLVSFCGVKDESVPVLKVGEFCKQCTEKYCQDIAMKNEKKSGEKAIIDLLKSNPQDVLRYYISKEWLNLWKETPDAMDGSDFVKDIVCEHGNLTCDKKKRITVPEEAFNYFKFNYSCSNIFENGTESCEICAAANASLKEQKDLITKMKSEAKKTFKSLIDSKGPVGKKAGCYYVLELEWFNDWVKWLKSNTAEEFVPFNNRGLLCDHGLFKWDPASLDSSDDKKYVLVPEDQYKKFKEEFGEKDALDLTISYEDGKEPLASKETCWDCFISASEPPAEFVNSFVTLRVPSTLEYDTVESALEGVKALEAPEKAVKKITIIRKDQPPKTTKNPQKPKVKSLKIEGISHDFVVSGLKMMIEMNYPEAFKNPNGYPLTLIFNGAVMDNEDAPLSSYNIREGSEIYLVLIKPIKQESLPPQKKKVPEHNGFSGSVLLGSK